MIREENFCFWRNLAFMRGICGREEGKRGFGIHYIFSIFLFFFCVHFLRIDPDATRMGLMPFMHSARGAFLGKKRKEKKTARKETGYRFT